MKKGTLYLIPSFLSETNYENVFPNFNRKIIFRLDEFIVEELRTARRFLRKVGYTKDFNKTQFHILNEHTDLTEIEKYLKNIALGKNSGLLSEAGIPCVADPGAEIVRIAQEMNIRVIPLIGPSSIFLALMASGFNGQNFAFHGYLPIDKKDRKKKILEIEQYAKKHEQTQIFIETPYRNNQMLQSILEVCASDTLVCVASNITAENETIKTKRIKDWSKTIPNLHKSPAVFLMYH